MSSYRTTRAFATEGASAAALASRLEQKTYELAISEWNNGAERRGARATAEAMLPEPTPDPRDAEIERNARVTEAFAECRRIAIEKAI